MAYNKGVQCTPFFNGRFCEMSKGTPNQTFRLLPSLKEECERTIARRNDNSFESPWTFTEFIELALREKIAKMERSRRSKGRVRYRSKSVRHLDQVESVTDQVDNGVERV